MTEHIHTDECWDPDSGCDMGRNEEFVGVCSPEETKRINDAIDEMADLVSEAFRIPAYILDEDTRYNKTYDGYYNVHTREWLEKPCSDDDCEFCARRPDLAPLEAEEYKGLVHPLPDEISEQEREQYIWGSNAAYEYAAKLRRKKEE